MENKMLDDPNRKYVPKKEFITYSVSALGQGMIYAIMSSYISDFYLNVLRVTPIFVLLLMFLARIWDAINDPLMGMIMDAHEPKHGKMLTYIIATPIPIALLTFSLLTVYCRAPKDSESSHSGDSRTEHRTLCISSPIKHT
jgi:Na+/melibiose symporter-like transporter